ncbi:MAG: DUF2007 domain-containing protein [Thermoguttaceae bacterium]
MWYCPKCNEAIDDALGDCPICGARSDGTPDPDFRNKQDGSVESESERDPKRDDRLDVVELCSAADTVEAFAIADALNAAGVKASVVGDTMQAIAAGGIPLGEAGTPRIWVTRQQEQEARQVLDQYQADLLAGTAEPPEEAADSEPNDEELVEGALPEAETPHRVSLLSVLLVLAGLGAIGAGVYYGVSNSALRHRFSQTAEAKLVGAERWSEQGEWTAVPPGDLRGRSTQGDQSPWKARYRFTADGQPHEFLWGTLGMPNQTMLVHYNAAKPTECWATPILAPAWCIAIGAAFGAMLLFLGYQFR